MYTIRRFSVMKTATVVAVMYVILVAIFIVPFAILAIAFGRGDSAAGGVVAVLVFGLAAALIYGVIGWILTAIGCAVYNLAAGWVGGIEVHVDLAAPPAPPQIWTPSPPAGTPSAPPGAPPAP